LTPIICPNPLLKKKERKENQSTQLSERLRKRILKKKGFQTIEQEKLNEHEGENKGGEQSI
jgi:hypothetical protein